MDKANRPSAMTSPMGGILSSHYCMISTGISTFFRLQCAAPNAKLLVKYGIRGDTAG